MSLLSMYKLPHQREHCDDSPYYNRKLRPQDEVGGWKSRFLRDAARV